MYREKLTNKTPASFYSAAWREATPLGNGHIGASVYGYAAHERILVNHENLWTGNTRPTLPDVSDQLPVVRRLLRENRFYEAQEVMGDALKARGYHPEVAVPAPLCDLLIETPVRDGFTHYSRTLDIARGESVVRFFDRGEYVRRCFVSRADGALILELTGDLRNVTLEIDVHDPLNATRPFGRQGGELPTDVIRRTADGALFFQARARKAPRFGAALRVLAGEYAVEGNRIVLRDCPKAVAALIPCVDDGIEAALEAAQARLAQLPGDYEALLAAHEQKHRPLFEGCRFDLGSRSDRCNEELLTEAFSEHASDELFEKMYAFARYLLIAACDEYGLPCSLLGLWHGDYHADWALNMLNENLQMTHWQALSGNLPRLLLPLFDYFDALLPDFRENARRLFNCRGIFVPSITTPGNGLLPDLQNHIIHWTAGGAWLAQHYYQYYLYTRDEDFLKNRAIPFMEECAAFYLDFFTLGEDGYYLSSPSSSPENTPGNFEYGALGGRHPEVTMNATMDFAAVKELLSNLVSASRVATVPRADEYREALTHIPPYQANEDGALREWMHPYYDDRYAHRHQSHIYPFFPGHEIKQDDPRCAMVVKAIEKRLSVGLSAQSGWSLAHMAHVWARLGRGEEARNCLDLLLRCFVMNNLFTVHNDWRNMGVGMVLPPAPFQIDANMGYASAVHEMLLQSDAGEIELFPALPDQWTRGSLGTLLAAGGIRVELAWDEDGGQAALCAPIETRVRVSAFGVPQGEVALPAGQRLTLRFSRSAVPTATC